jgi:transcriptional regulator with XRE-family HTH domain
MSHNRGLSGRQPGARTAGLVRELTAERIRQHRTQVDVLRAMGGSWGDETLSVVERGATSPTVEFLSLWAEALGRPLTLAEPPDGGSR